MKQYIQALSASAEMHITDSALLEYDPSTDSTTSVAAAVRRYYLLTSNSLVTREAPLVSRSDKLMIWAHATDVGNLLGILRQRDIHPMEHLEVPGCNIFYALGHRLYGHVWDNHNVARVLYNTLNSAKNLSGVVVSGKAWGSLDKVQGGSCATALKATQDDEVYKDANARAYCVPRNRYHINSISFEQLAVPPLTATTLVAAHDRAMGVPSARRAILH